MAAIASDKMNKTTILFKKLVVPVGMRSIYWKYFGFPGNDDGEILTREKIICTLCKTQMAYNGNTSNLRMHLQNKHSAYLMNLEATSAPYIPKSREKVKAPKRRADNNPVVHSVAFDGSVELGNASNNTHQSSNSGIKYISIGDGNEASSVEYITADSLGDTVTYYLPEDGSGPSGPVAERDMPETILKFITSELLSPNIIEGQGFQRLVSKLNPSVMLPSLKQLEEEYIPQQYVDLKNGIISEIESLNEISLSVEEWQGVDGQTFVTLSAHFLHEDQLVTRTLPTVQWTKENQDVINKTLTLWSVTHEKVTAVVTATSNPDLLRTLEKWGPTVPCFLYMLQQAVSACLNISEVENVIKTCRNILNNFKTQQSFSDEQLASYNIQRDYPKLWTSTYELLQEFINNKSEIQSLTLSSVDKLSSSDWEVLTIIVDILSPFKVTVQTLQEENPALLSIIKPLLWQLVTNYLQIKGDESTLSETLKILLKSKLSNAFNIKSNNLLLQMATTLDPRFKQLSYATEDEGAAVQQNIKTLLSQIVSENGDSQASTSNLSSPSPAKKRLSGMELLLGDLCSMKHEAMRPIDRAELELGQYTSESPVAFDDNPLAWWQNAEAKCPNMSKLSKRYMCIPACAIPSSRIPNKQRELFEHQRSTLSLDYVDKIVFLNGNLM